MSGVAVKPWPCRYWSLHAMAGWLWVMASRRHCWAKRERRSVPVMWSRKWRSGEMCERGPSHRVRKSSTTWCKAVGRGSTSFLVRNFMSLPAGQVRKSTSATAETTLRPGTEMQHYPSRQKQTNKQENWVVTVLSFKVMSFLSECLKEVATVLSFKVKSSLWECLKGNSIILQGEEFPQNV